MAPSHNVVFKDDKDNILKIVQIYIVNSEHLDKVLVSLVELCAEYKMPAGYSVEVIPISNLN